MMTDRSREVISLDVRFFQGLQASLQHGPSALRHSREIDRTHTFENGLFGAGRSAFRLLVTLYRDEAKIHKKKAAAVLHKTG